MILLPIEDIKPGMFPGVRIVVRKNRQDMTVVTPKHALREKDLQLLRDSYGIRSMWVNFGLTRDLGELLNADFEAEERTLLEGMLDDTQKTQESFAAQGADRGEAAYQARKYVGTIENLFRSLVGDKRRLSLLSRINFGRVETRGGRIVEDSWAHLGRFMTNAAALTAALCSVMRDRIYYYKQQALANTRAGRQTEAGNIFADLVQIALGALFCDVGYADPAVGKVLAHRCAYSPEQDGIARRHVALGVGMLRATDASPITLAAVMQSHQHFDGSGFPVAIETKKGEKRPREGNEIHISARIVALVKDYLELLMYRDMLPVEALCRMRREYVTRYDPEIKASFDAIIMPFPIGEKVRLSNGVDAVVTDFDPAHPCRPVVAVIEGPDGIPGFNRNDYVDLSDPRHGEVSIISHRGRDVAKYLFNEGAQEAEYVSDITELEKPQEERQAERLDVMLIGIFTAEPVAGQKMAVKGQVTDVSETGAFIAGDIPLGKGDRGELKLVLAAPGKGALKSVVIPAEIVRVQKNAAPGIGVKFIVKPGGAFGEIVALAKIDRPEPARNETPPRPKIDLAKHVFRPITRSFEQAVYSITAASVQKTELKPKEEPHPVYPYSATIRFRGDIDSLVVVSMPKETIERIIKTDRGWEKDIAYAEIKEILSRYGAFIAALTVKLFENDGFNIEHDEPVIEAGGRGAILGIESAKVAFTVLYTSDIGNFAVDMGIEKY